MAALIKNDLELIDEAEKIYLNDCLIGTKIPKSQHYENNYGFQEFLKRDERKSVGAFKNLMVNLNIDGDIEEQTKSKETKIKSYT